MKRIIFCADGTWDNSGKNTNVYRLFKALQISADQMPFYDDGVGADGLPLEQLLGGAFGFGLFQKIKDGYTKISQVYEEGDELFLFGFSRGAYTARSLAGMIAVCGLPTGSFSDEVVEAAFNAYRNKDQRDQILTELKKSCPLYDSKLTMLGVWDTVGSLGIPAIFGGVSPVTYGFLDTSLHSDVLNAYHALAIDERRCEFPATLWTSAPQAGQTIEQVWFTGVHSDIGGSYPDDPDGTALSDITLGWMMKKAADLGLHFVPSVLTNCSLPLNPKLALDTKHESWNPIWGFPKTRAIESRSTLANSVAVRCQHDPSYKPGNLTITGGAPASTYQILDVVKPVE